MVVMFVISLAVFTPGSFRGNRRLRDGRAAESLSTIDARPSVAPMPADPSNETKRESGLEPAREAKVAKEAKLLAPAANLVQPEGKSTDKGHEEASPLLKIIDPDPAKVTPMVSSLAHKSAPFKSIPSFPSPNPLPSLGDIFTASISSTFADAGDSLSPSLSLSLSLSPSPSHSLSACGSMISEGRCCIWTSSGTRLSFQSGVQGGAACSSTMC